MTTAQPPDGTTSSGGETTPPLSTVPPPTMGRPTAPPKNPSDASSAQTMTGVATRQASTGCILLTLDNGAVVQLIGPTADSALAHPRVTVVAMPRPNAITACDLPSLEVQSVAVA